MKVYLVQHGRTVDEISDPRRPLSEQGIAETEKIARLAADSGSVRIGKIIHSGKLRARQTAEIFARALSPAPGIQEMSGLSPMDEPDGLVRALESEKSDLMVVGHLPHLSRTVALLVCGDEKRMVVTFRNSGIIALERAVDDTWTIIPVFAA